MKCPMCNGVGGFYQSICYKNDLYEECPVCDGDGSMPLFAWLSYQFWTNVPVWFIEFWDNWRTNDNR